MCFFWGMASLMIFSLLPTFLKDVLKASHKQIGWIEGLAVSIAFLGKVFSGILSDYKKTRYPFIKWGAFFTIAGKACFALSLTTIHIFFARSLDRFIKGWRSAPLDALMADLSDTKKKGLIYGIKQTFHILGGVFGALIASLLISITNGNYRLVFALSILPAFCAFLILLCFVKDHDCVKKKWQLGDLKLLPSTVWIMIATTFIFMLARFSVTFLNLRLKEVGWSLVFIPLMTSLYEMTHALVAWPIGHLADKINKNTIFSIGILVLTCANILIVLIPGRWGIVMGFIAAAFHMGMTQGLMSSIIVEQTPSHLIGTAFSIYYCVEGLSVLLGNGIAGHLASLYHSSLGAFYGGLFFSFAGFVVFTF